jgi:hypothetical protein
MRTSTEPSTEAGSPIDAVTVVVDPRVAYVGFGPDDGPLAKVARDCDAEDVIEDLADAAERLDFAYLRAWENAARRIAPDVAWNASAPYHQSPTTTRCSKKWPRPDARTATGRR